MKRIALSRRQLLGATGLLAGSLFLPSRARAQGAPPKRLVVFYTQHGVVPDNWRMRPNGVPEGVSFDEDITALAENEFSPILQPLHAFRDKLLVVDGLSMASAEADLIANGHDVGTRHSLTGKRMVDGASGGPSIDQVVAQQVRAQGRIDSLELSIIATASGGAVFRDAAQSIPADSSPGSVFDRVFPPSSGKGELSDADRVRTAQASVLDLVAAEYERTAPKLSGADRAKLDLHRDLVRGVEQRIIELGNVVCEAPPRPNDSNQGPFNELIDRFASSMFGLTAAALACDLTRVVTIQSCQLDAANIGAPPGDVHADYAHQASQNPTAKEFMTNYGRYHAQQFAELLALLDSIPEAGGTLLDSCAVVWCGELADGDHNYHTWPAVVAGGAMRGGRYVRMEPNTPNPSVATNFPNYVPLIGAPHNRFWVSVANAVGADVDTLGDAELTTPSGERIDCSGPLPELA
jgi:hypothetical protein